METLAARIDRAGPLDTAEAVILAARLARALEPHHERGEAHGAVSPESLMVGRDDKSPVVLRASSRSTPSVHHQSPERLAGGEASPEDDTWAIGSTLYLALTGTVPFPGDDAAEVAARVEQGSITPLAVFDAGDDDLQELVQGIFQRGREERTRSVVRVRKSLARWLAKRGIAPGPPLEIKRGESAHELDLSSIPPPPSLPEVEDRPTIPRAASVGGVLYTFADEDTTLPKDTGPVSMPPSSGSRDANAPLSSRIPPTSELLARAKAAQSKTPAPPDAAAERGMLKPAELANRLRQPSIPPSGPRLNPPKVARERAAKALSERPPAVSSPELDAGSLKAPGLPKDLLPEGAPESSRPEAPLDSVPPSSKRSTPPPLPVASTPPRKKSSGPPPLPVSSAPPKADRKSKPPRVRASEPETKEAPEARASSGASPLTKVALVAGALVLAFVGYRALSGGEAADPTPAPTASASSAAASNAASSSAASSNAASSSAASSSAASSSAALASTSATGEVPSISANAPAAASAAPSAVAPSASVASAPLSAPEDISACVVKLFPPDSFAEGKTPKLDFVCRESDPREGAQKVHEILVRAGMGRTVSDGMREWAIMGWYELAAFAALRGRCCESPRALELPPSPGTCPSMQDALEKVSMGARAGSSEAQQDEALTAFRKSLSCTIKSGKAKPFGAYPRPAGGEDTAFMKTYQRARAR